MARTLVKQFDEPKTTTGAVSTDKDDEICQLAGDLDYDREKRQTQEALLWESLETASNRGPDDNVEYIELCEEINHYLSTDTEGT